MTSEPEFTPGPWSVSDVNADDLQNLTRYGNVVVYADKDCITHPIADCSCNRTCRQTDEQVANARLISAAPDLYAALDAVLAKLVSLIPDTERTPEIAAAREALGKAVGSTDNA